jgi:cell division septum initiation protein DivIVA
MDENLPVNPGTHREDSFDSAVRGYHRGQVDEYVARSNQLLATLEQHLAVARSDAQRAQTEAARTRDEIERLRVEHAEAKPVHEEVSGRLSQILRLAAEEADQERATAEAEIAKLRSESQAEAERAVAEARAQAEHVVATARQTAEQELADARAAADRDLTSARQEAERLRLASVRQTQDLLDEARRRATAVNEVSNHRLETLTATHGEAVLRLGQIRDVLADLLDRDTAAGSLSEMVESVLAPEENVPDVEDLDIAQFAVHDDEVLVEDETPALTASGVSDVYDVEEVDLYPAPAQVTAGREPVFGAEAAETAERVEPVPPVASLEEPAADPAGSAAARRSLDVDAEIDLTDRRVRTGGPLPHRR